MSTETKGSTGSWTIHSVIAGALMPSLLGAMGALLVTLLIHISAASAAGQPVRVQGGRWLLAGRAYESAKLSAHPHLIVVIQKMIRQAIVDCLQPRASRISKISHLDGSRFPCK